MNIVSGRSNRSLHARLAHVMVTCPPLMKLAEKLAGDCLLQHAGLAPPFDRVDFRLNGERITLREGECWYLRLSDPHSVTNGGDTDRIRLVIDAAVNEWLMDLLRSWRSPFTRA